jgi:hypothetical protein
MRVRVALATTAVCAALGGPASAYVTIGPNYAPDPNASQAINYPSGSLLFNAASPPGIRLFSPISGVITSWRVYLGDVTSGTVRVRVMSPAGGSDWTVWRSGPVMPLETSTGQANLHAFTAHVPILAGQGIGLEKTHAAGGSVEITQPQDVGDPSWMIGDFSTPPSDGGTGTAQVYSSNGLFRAISADIEADADGDLFGDDSQDRCPNAAGDNNGCPPPPPDPGPPAPSVEVRTEVHTITPAGALASIDPGSVRFTAKRRALTGRVTCPVQTSPACAGRLAARVALPAAAGLKARTLRLGGVAFKVPQGATRTAAIPLSARTRRAIARLRRLRITVSLTTTKTTRQTVG